LSSDQHDRDSTDIELTSTCPVQSPVCILRSILSSGDSIT